VRGKPLTVSADRVKPAYIFNEADFRNTVYNPALTAMPPIPPTHQNMEVVVDNIQKHNRTNI
jgi:hypothetical protein